MDTMAPFLPSEWFFFSYCFTVHSCFIKCCNISDVFLLQRTNWIWKNIHNAWWVLHCIILFCCTDTFISLQCLGTKCCMCSFSRAVWFRQLYWWPTGGYPSKFWVPVFPHQQGGRKGEQKVTDIEVILLFISFFSLIWGFNIALFFLTVWECQKLPVQMLLHWDLQRADLWPAGQRLSQPVPQREHQEGGVCGRGCREVCHFSCWSLPGSK